MKVGILGSGNVGQALGRGLIARGHEVKMGSREKNNEKGADWAKKEGARASTGDFGEAARFGEMVILATLWTGTENALQMAGAENLAGKVLMDVTNPLKAVPGAMPVLAVGLTDSGGESVQRWAPNARVVKAFNSVGFMHMVDPQMPGGPPSMFICGNDVSAKEQVGEIVKSFGWEVVDVGGIAEARDLEPLCTLWLAYGAKTNTWGHAFKLLRK
jgi:predicted dinucleotide-binding enzyme